MADWQDFYTTSQDGLKLFARRLGPAISPRPPVLCLPGIARSTADFEEVAAHLARHGDRAVWAFDYRGRGRSDYDPNWENYDLRIELGDILDQMTALGISEAIFLGTSRGGLLTMLVAMMRPAAVRGAILNDIGPIIEGKGLARIKSYVGKLPKPRTYAEAGQILKSVSSTQFPALDDVGWERMARRTWRDKDGGLVSVYDTNLLKTLEKVDLDAPLPELWPQFGALTHVPVLVLRGAHSDILSPETAREMTRRHPACALWEVPYEGHAPLLGDLPTLERIETFVSTIPDEVPVPAAQ
ncbi:MAG: alpha/beta hydrolase [Proteobacteria bacterium]|nr:alpha/beta hydrolase [Pseudomonadota bacterium]